MLYNWLYSGLNSYWYSDLLHGQHSKLHDRLHIIEYI